MPSRERATDVLQAALAAAVAAGLPREAATRIDREVRAELGGARYYLAMRPAEQRAARIGEALATGTSPLGCVGEHGCRSTVYRTLRRPWVAY